MRYLLLQFLMIFPCFSFENELIRLNGPRQPEINVTKNEKFYHIIVVMKPVACFDAQTNEKLNIRKAKAYGTIGLHRFLGLNPKQFLKIKSRDVQGINTNNNRTVITMSIPVDSVDVIPVPNSLKTILKSDDNELSLLETNFFTVKSDYLDTISFISIKLVNEFPIFTEIDNFEFEIAEYEEKIHNYFSAIQKEISKDILLFSVDKTELSSQIDRSESLVKLQLKEYYIAKSKE